MAAAARVPKVVLIVGPAGTVTPSYRQLADKAAVVAADAGAQVVKVYSPNATWDVVRGALDGASIVVYLGHGNGWPSPYRNELYPPTQNGFGLNPVAGVDDSAHQYFGEDAVGKLHLARNAVVLLHHLCYASGNTEPGRAEGTRDQAIARVDNYAAGFLRAGAAAVVAEAHMGPAYYVKALLRGRSSIEATWNASPSANGHTFTFTSTRTPGFVARLDPNRADGGYYRSLVSRGVTAEELRAGSTGSGGGTIIGSAVAPSLVGRGLAFGELSFASLPIAATSTRLTLPLKAGAAKQIPAKTKAGVRWDPILLELPSAPIAGPDASTSPSPEPTPSPTPTPLPIPMAATLGDGSPTPAPTTDPGPSPTPAPVGPPVDLVEPEQIGAVVDVVPVVRTSAGLRIQVTYPTAPGLYRLVVTLHDPSGVAYDAATQALLVPMIVRVGGPVAAAYGAPSTLVVPAGTTSSVAVRLMNAGSERWDRIAPAPPNVVGEVGVERIDPSPARLVATWVSAGGLAVPEAVTVVLGADAAEAGAVTNAVVPLVAPSEPGSYLLLLDVVSPDHGPLSAIGSEPAMIRVTVGDVPIPVPDHIPVSPTSLE